MLKKICGASGDILIILFKFISDLFVSSTKTFSWSCLVKLSGLKSMMSQHSSTSPTASTDLVCPLLASELYLLTQGKQLLFGLCLFHRKSWLLWTRRGIQNTFSVLSVDPFLEQKVQKQNFDWSVLRGYWVAEQTWLQCFILNEPLCLLTFRVPREGRKGVLQTGLLWHVCP